MPSSGSTTRVDLVYRRLRSDILNGRLEAGSRLGIESLSARYGVSGGVLREALPRLVGQGLAVSLPQQGFRVISVSAEDLRHLTEARVAIETQVLRQSVESGSVGWEAQLLASHHNLRRTPYATGDGDISEDWTDAHMSFHRALLAGCANPRLVAIADMLRETACVYQCWSRRPGDDRNRDIAAEHAELCDLALERDAAGAVAALARHIELTTQLILGEPEA